MDLEGVTLNWVERLPAPDWGAAPDAIVWIDPTLFDGAWRLGDQWISRGGKTGAQDNRYVRVGERIEAGNRIDMCMAWMDGEKVGFVDGRHRFAWVRDRGVQAVPIQVSPENSEKFTRRFGTALRVSLLPAKPGLSWI